MSAASLIGNPMIVNPIRINLRIYTVHYRFYLITYFFVIVQMDSEFLLFRQLWIYKESFSKHFVLEGLQFFSLLLKLFISLVKDLPIEFQILPDTGKVLSSIRKSNFFPRNLVPDLSYLYRQ